MRWALLLFLLAGCAKADAPAEAASSSPCGQQLFDGSRFTVCDPSGGKLRLIAAARDETPLRTFADLSRKLDPSTVAFAMNAGMFDEAGRPIGLAIVGGKPVHKINLRAGGGNFHLKPNGVFFVLAGGKPAIFASGRIPEFRAPPELATQSGPMLVIDGKLHPAFDRDGSSRYIRNGVGVTAGGKALFVISQDPVSFGKFARFFRDGLKTPNALFFDGAVSSLWDPANGRQDSHALLGPVIVALKPQAAASKPGREAPARP